ncbi:MAG: DUF3426 domain-containing protein [Woeseiaceae bacterium]|nr:DUF3426 domain-containing protein [Woeseiaceae bacterium]
MYTQCPDCSTAFRVTATVLKQAAGKVRCGGCGNAFNALEYLSESMPEQPAANEAQENLPELTPEPLPKDDGLPKSISAEQSAALLKTLDELAGSDIRIEDTGVEWRVLDENEYGESPVDEVLEESPTPVDQFLTETPAQIDSPEIFDEEANDPAQTPVDELRFDDNTPLPDDFDFSSEATPTTVPAEEQEAEEDIEEVVAEPQPDVDLSEPEEWTDILDEFEDLGAAAAMPLDEELAALDEELAEEPSIAEPPAEEPTAGDGGVDDLLDMDTQFALQAEAMGIDLSGIHDTAEADSSQAREAGADGQPDLDDEPSLDEGPSLDEEPSLDELLNESGDADREIEDLLDEELVDEIEAVEEQAADEPLEGQSVDEEPVDEQLVDEQLVDEEVVNDVDVDDQSDEDPVEDAAEQLELIDESSEDDEPVVEFDQEVSQAEEAETEDDLDIPPLSAEEQTLNMQIDAELMAIAVEDDDGFASTIIIPDAKAEEAALAEKSLDDGTGDGDDTELDEDQAERDLKDTSAGFETIIMEGEEIRSGLASDEAKEEDKAAAAALVGAAAAEREAERDAAPGNRRWMIVAGAVVLALLLALQAIHQQRDVLAKSPAFNNIAGPLYRAIGQPLAPDWDITGWRFEATKGSTDEGDQNLTIYSRLGNKLDEPLPYPIIAISLTDRFEETIGSRILDPSDYLAGDLDPRKLVEPGNTFNAVMSIAAPDPEATGFKLNVCYRQTGGDLRCAIDDFK